MTYSDKYCNGDYQQAVSEFWSKWGGQLCNEFISYLQTKDDHDYVEEVLNVSGGEDWESPGDYHIDNDVREEELKEFIAIYFIVDQDNMTFEEVKHYAKAYINDGDYWQEYCEHFNLDPEPVEVFQHFIVSDNMAHWLKEKGELVEDDIMGFSVWGRTCFGQAVYLDKVICDIYDDIEGDNWKTKE